MGQPKLVVITAVDGGLVDRVGHSSAAAALAHLKRAGVPVVLCSSQTRAELERLRQELGLSDPFISENGGALFAPIGAFPFPLTGAVGLNGYEVVEFGKPHREVLEVLKRVAAREGVPVSMFSDMSVQDVADECGITLAAARLAKLRGYDEPYRVAASDPSARARLCRALRAAGLRCANGGRYDHVTSGANKGLAAVFLRRCYERQWGHVTTVGLGEAAIDLELLKAVDVPVVVRGPDAEVTAALAAQLRGGRVTTAAGPAGWSEAVEAILHRYEGSCANTVST